MRVVVVGASLAGVSAAEHLRRGGYDGEILLIGAEDHLPYDRPPLSKALLQGSMEPAAVWLHPREHYEDLRIELALGRRALRLRPEAQRIDLDDGESIAYDRLIIATGAEPRCPPALGAHAGVHLLRTLDDALALRQALTDLPRVAVVGGGFIGLEVAASARQLGCEVTVVEVLPTPLAAAVGTGVGAAIAGLHEDHGVRVATGVPVSECLGAGRVEAIALEDGREIPADVVVVGVGVKPTTAWVEDSGIAVGDGILVDEFLRTSVPSVFAAGDVARVCRQGGSERVEHWTSAVEQGRLAAENLLADPAEGLQPLEALPTFWSDQYEAKIRTAGRLPDPQAVHVVHHRRDALRLIALATEAETLSGVLTINLPSAIARLRPLIGEQGALPKALEVLDGMDCLDEHAPLRRTGHDDDRARRV